MARRPLGYTRPVLNPAIRSSRVLRNKNAVGYRLLWAEADLPDPLVLEEAGWQVWRVKSGTPGHWHLYQPLDSPISYADWELQAEKLKGGFWGTEAKSNAAKFVRIPGTWNRKVEAATDAGYALDHTLPPTDRAGKAIEVAAMADDSWWRPVRLIKPAGAPIPWKTVMRSVRVHGWHRCAWRCEAASGPYRACPGPCKRCWTRTRHPGRSPSSVVSRIPASRRAARWTKRWP